MWVRPLHSLQTLHKAVLLWSPVSQELLEEHTVPGSVEAAAVLEGVNVNVRFRCDIWSALSIHCRSTSQAVQKVLLDLKKPADLKCRCWEPKCSSNCCRASVTLWRTADLSVYTCSLWCIYLCQCFNIKLNHKIICCSRRWQGCGMMTDRSTGDLL